MGRSLQQKFDMIENAPDLHRYASPNKFRSDLWIMFESNFVALQTYNKKR